MIKFLTLFIFSISLLFGKTNGNLTNQISYQWEITPQYDISKKIFFEAFYGCYRDVPLEILKKPSREAVDEWLLAVFEELYLDFQNKGDHLRWISAKVDEKTVGFLVIDLENYPLEIYLSQMAVDPMYQRCQIGSTLIQSVLDQFPEAEKFVVITRRANVQAVRFYQALDFKLSSYIHPGYSPDIYMGLEYPK